MGCQWKMLPIDRNAKGLPEIHPTRIYQLVAGFDADFVESVRTSLRRKSMSGTER
jgi:hypothetical protein